MLSPEDYEKYYLEGINSYEKDINKNPYIDDKDKSDAWDAGYDYAFYYYNDPMS